MRVATVVLAVTAVASVARAQPDGVPPDGVPIDWIAPAGCPARGAVVSEVEGLLGEVDWSAHAGLGARVEVTRRGGEWVVSVVTAEPEGTRRVVGATCEEVAAAAALIVAMAIDPELGAGPEPEPDRSAHPERSASPGDARSRREPEPEPEPVAVAAAAVSVPIEWSVGAGGGVEVGALPGVGGGVGATVAVSRGRWRAEVGGAYYFARTESLADFPELQGELSLWYGVARVCRRVVGFDACSGAELGQVRGQAMGFTGAEADAELWLAPVVGIGREVALGGGLALRAGAELAIPLSRPRSLIDPDGAGPLPVEQLHQPAPVNPRVHLGVAWVFR
jgi:hypothetical protein